MEFTLDYSGGNMVITGSGIPQQKIPLSSFLSLISGKPFGGTENDFIKEQQQINYLDSLKDKANKYTLDSLRIYPEAETNQNLSHLNQYKKNVFEEMKNAGKITYTSWQKVSNETKLDTPKQYEEACYDSGLRADKYMKNGNNDTKIVNTFGSYIDSALKVIGHKTFPNDQNTVTISKSFMRLMGFGDSTLTAKTLSGTSKKFGYTLKIACGDSCKTPPNCDLSYDGKSGADPNEKFFLGNANKNSILKTSANSDDKVKLLVLKEWGDKMQVLIYFLYYHAFNPNVTLSTCDDVVFLMCISLQIPCVCTHPIDMPDNKVQGNFHSIQEFKPSETPVNDIYTRFNNKRKQIIEENNDVINLIDELKNNPSIKIYIGDVGVIFKQELYEQIYSDIIAINNELNLIPEKVINVQEPSDKSIANREIMSVSKELTELEKKYLLIQFIKKKKNDGTKIVMLSHKWYTNTSYGRQSSFQSKKPFVDIALQHYKQENVMQTTLSQRGRIRKQRQIGGTKRSNQDNEEERESDETNKRFKIASQNNEEDSNDVNMEQDVDDDYDYTPKMFYYTKEKLNVDETYNIEDSNRVFPDDNLWGQLQEKDLQLEFDTSFKTAFHEFLQDTDSQEMNMNEESDVIHNMFGIKAYEEDDGSFILDNTLEDTIYTMLLYKSYFEKGSSSYITKEMIKDIVNEVNVEMPDVEMPDVVRGGMRGKIGKKKKSSKNRHKKTKRYRKKRNKTRKKRK